jgi:acetolactate synthase-1/2/3 large subunit
MEYDGPAIIDFKVEQEENVYPMIPTGTTVKQMIEEPKPERAIR